MQHRTPSMLHASMVPWCELPAALALLRGAMLHVADYNNMLRCGLLHAGLFGMLHAAWFECRISQVAG
jgi:hypothetical protein